MMGPWHTSWYEENNIPSTEKTEWSELLQKNITFKAYDNHYAGGRIDIRGVPDEPFGLEYSLPIMEARSWGRLSNWLENFSSEEVVPYEDLLSEFEKQTGQKIIWFSSN